MANEEVKVVDLAEHADRTMQEGDLYHRIYNNGVNIVSISHALEKAVRQGHDVLQEGVQIFDMPVDEAENRVRRLHKQIAQDVHELLVLEYPGMDEQEIQSRKQRKIDKILALVAQNYLNTGPTKPTLYTV